jgi:lipopolysaccharide transport system ATP-binding protein
MSDVIISVEELGKKYVLSHQGERGGYTRFSEKLESWIKKPFAALAGGGRREVEGNLPPTSFHLPQPSHEEFWALKDVSFEVKRGEVVGIIGRNGAGKSTLLKILSRITEPTEGRVTLRGRVASLLEVGTGFHPELTGRENIFLNGAILGMTKAEIKKKFDEIVAFAEVERFLDTPVKRYSSGMYVRLAFAVAAHLEPEILVVDEVLAVGDAEFQKKCLGKMKDVATGGRTVLFVSHNMGAVQTLCSQGLLLNRGCLEHAGPIRETIQKYLAQMDAGAAVQFEGRKDKPSITSVEIDREELKKGNLAVEIGFRSPFPLNPPVPGVIVSSALGAPVFGTNPRFHGKNYPGKSMSEGVLRVKAEKIPLISGNYQLSIYLGDWHMDYDQRLDACAFTFEESSQPSNRPASEVIGYLNWESGWSVASP